MEYTNQKTRENALAVQITFGRGKQAVTDVLSIFRGTLDVD